MEGTTIGPYRITGLIGQGGMGSVYAAEHTLLGRPAAIKVLHAEMSARQDVVVRFFNEARAATAIRHPGIVEIYDFGWHHQAAYIVMEKLHGESLGDRHKHAPMKWPMVLSAARQIAGALSAAHGKGIVHRDLKPDNVFLVLDPEVPGGERIKLLDFGIAKLAGDAITTGNMTRTGAVMGTPTYMAPEQCRGVALDHRADLYALGCIMFELCAGRPPFVGEGSGDVLAAHIHVPVPTLSSLGVQLPPPVEAVILNLLTKLPGDRTASADALIEAIDRVMPDRVQMLTGGQRPLARMETGAQPVLGGAGTAPGSLPGTGPGSLPGTGAGSLPGTGPGTAPVAGPKDVTTLSGAASATALPAQGGRRWLVIAGASAVALTIAAVVLLATRDHGRADDTHKVSYSEVTRPADPPKVVAPPKPVEEARPAVAPPKPEPVEDAKPAVAPPKPEPAPVADPAASPTDVELHTAPEGATVLLGGAVIGKTPLHTSLTHGDATLLVRLAGYADRSVAFHAGQALNERVTLVKPIKKAAPHTDRDKSVNPFGD